MCYLKVFIVYDAIPGTVELIIHGIDDLQPGRAELAPYNSQELLPVDGSPAVPVVQVDVKKKKDKKTKLVLVEEEGKTRELLKTKSNAPEKETTMRD